MFHVEQIGPQLSVQQQQAVSKATNANNCSIFEARSCNLPTETAYKKLTSMLTCACEKWPLVGQINLEGGALMSCAPSRIPILSRKRLGFIQSSFVGSTIQLFRNITRYYYCITSCLPFGFPKLFIHLYYPVQARLPRFICCIGSSWLERQKQVVHIHETPASE